MEPRKSGSWREPTRFNSRKAARGCRERPGISRPVGVEEQGMHTMGSPRNLGGLVVSVLEAGRGTGDQTPGLAAVRLPLRGANRGRKDGTAKRRQRSAAGRTARRRSAS
jgi:hypothetical protein